jgi:hypothetical protein
VLVHAGLEHEALDSRRPRRRLERGEHRSPDALASKGGLAVHPLDLCGRRVEHPDGAATDRAAGFASDEKRAAPILDLLRLEVRTEALLGRIERAKLGVERSDEPPGVVGVKSLSLNG